MLSKERYEHVVEKERLIEEEVARVKEINIGAKKEVQDLLESYGSIPLSNGIKLVDLIRRPELDYDKLAPIDKDRPVLSDEVREEVNIYIKYEGYLSRQAKQVAQFKKLESKLIPDEINYDDVSSLRIEARQKLSSLRPANIGQASRISGVSPADISVLLVYLESYYRDR